MSTLLTEAGTYIDADESADLTAILFDTATNELDKLAIQTLLLTIVDEQGNVINNRDKQDILDVNGGSLASDGTLLIKLSPEDNAFTGADWENTETHQLEIEWTWEELQGDIRTGKQVYEIVLRRMNVNR